MDREFIITYLKRKNYWWKTRLVEPVDKGTLRSEYIKKIRNYSGTLTIHLIFINIRIFYLPSNPADLSKNQYTMTSLLIPI